VPGIQIVAGERSDDPRLNGIDLRRRMQKVRVTVRDTRGDPIDGVEPIVLVDAAGSELRGAAAVGGTASILVPGATADLLVVAKGYEPRRIAGVGTDTEVRLDRYAQVTVRVVGGMPILPQGHRLYASLHEQDRVRDPRSIQIDGEAANLEQYVRPPASARQLDPQGTVSLPVAGSGTHVLQLSLRNESSRENSILIRPATIDGTTPAEVQVTAPAAGQVFEVTIPAAELEKALVRVRGR
jgi:hypothetical protein